jgi:hypothetical protein
MSRKKIDRNNHVCGLDLSGSASSYEELEYGTYSACYFFYFLFGFEVVHLVLLVDFFVCCIEESKVIPVWLKQC